jgi:hypothetical protein
MKYKLTFSQAFGRILAFLVITLLVVYAVSSCSIITNRSTESVVGTTWLSIHEKITFAEQDGYYFSTKDSDYFSYEIGQGYIICFSNEEPILELARLQDDRLLEVRTNTMFYNEAALSQNV